jgi:hypothetical protein
VLRPAEGGWRFEEANKVMINGKPKIRLGNPGQTEVSGSDYKRLSMTLAGAEAIRTSSNGVMLRRAGGGWAPVVPDGASVKTATSLATLWSGARLQLQKGKQHSDVNAADVFAVLPGAVAGDAVADFLMDPANFAGVGEKSGAAAFEERMALLVAVAGSASLSESASSKLKDVLFTAMDTAIQKTAGGISRYSDLEEGLRFSAVSAKAFPNDPQQTKARNKLNEWKAWLDLRMAVLRALAAGGQWDAFIDKYGDFERFDNSFDLLRTFREKAYRTSATRHLAEAKRLDEEKQFQPALVEARIALSRNPGDRTTQDILETIRIDEINAYRKLLKPKQVDTHSPEQTKLRRNLRFAADYILAKKWEQAKAEIAAAEALDKDSPQIVLTNARLLKAQEELQKALEVLDNYARRVKADDDINTGDALRDDILVALRTSREKISDQIAKAENTGDYVGAMSAAADGVKLDPDNPYFLYHAGLGSAVLRDEAKAEEHFKSYLRASQAMSAERERRAEVLGILPILHAARVTPSGKPNWFSGYPSPADSFYCPVSLMPAVRPMYVRGARKEATTFEWQNGGKLASVSTVDANPGGGTVTFYFDYFPDGSGVRRVSTKPFTQKEHDLPAPLFTPGGTIVPNSEGTWFALFNHPQVNPYMVERLTGKRVATVVAGNPYFHPFIWTGIHTFLAEYDSAGHILSATEIGAKNGAPKPLDFSWDGNRLMAISERGGTYQREMHYGGGRLLSETVHYTGQTSKIEYKYEGERLTEANCDSDASIDGRSRHVSFRE